MARYFTCTCGKRYKIAKWNACTKSRCVECKQRFEYPPYVEIDKLEEVDEDEPAEEEPDDGLTLAERLEQRERREKAGKPTEGKCGVCLICEEEGKGKFVPFYTAVVDSANGFIGGGDLRHVTYRNIRKVGVFLCERCAREEYNKHTSAFAIGFLALGTILILGGILVACIVTGKTRDDCVGGIFFAILGGLVCLGVGLVFLWRLFLTKMHPSTLQSVGVSLVCRRKIDLGPGNVYLTPTDVKRYRRSGYLVKYWFEITNR
jgi:hypothetical protein